MGILKGKPALVSEAQSGVLSCGPKGHGFDYGLGLHTQVAGLVPGQGACKRPASHSVFLFHVNVSLKAMKKCPRVRIKKFAGVGGAQL